MSQVQIFNRTFLRGLETTRDEGGAPDWSGFRRFLNTRVGKDEAERRGGMAVVATIPDPSSSAQFIGNDATAFLRPEVWALDRPDWALDFLIELTDPNGTHTFLDTGSLQILMTGGTLSFRVGTVTLQTTAKATSNHLAFTRDEDGYHLLDEGVEVDSDPYAAPGAASATVVMGGEQYLDFLRLRAPGPSDWGQRECRLLNPRARGVLACYRDEQDADGILWDHSIYEAHFACGAMGAAGGRLRDIPHNPVQGMDTYVDEDDRRRLFVVAGGQEFDAPYE